MKFFKLVVGKKLDFANHSDNRMNCPCAGCATVGDALDKRVSALRKK